MSSKTVGIKLDKNNLTEQKINLHNTSTEEINSSFLNSQVIFNFDGTVNIKQEEDCSSEKRLTSEGTHSNSFHCNEIQTHNSTHDTSSQIHVTGNSYQLKGYQGIVGICC